MSDDSFTTALGLLRDPNVRRLFAAYLVTYSGTAMAPIAMAFGVLELTGSAADSAIVIAAPTLGSIAVLLVGGVIADRTSRKRVMWIAELVSMASQLTMAFLFLSGQASVPLLTGLMLINGIAIAFHMPAATGLIVQLVDHSMLQSVNALLGVARNGALAGGAEHWGYIASALGIGTLLGGLAGIKVRPRYPMRTATILVFFLPGCPPPCFSRHRCGW